MFYRIYMSFIRILLRDQIPLLPRGYLATEYDDVPDEKRRIMARLGSRDFAGVKRAMKQHGVNTIEELAAKLEHQKPRRNIRQRLKLAIGRVVGGHETDPHRAEIIIALNHRNKGIRQREIEERLKNVQRRLK